MKQASNNEIDFLLRALGRRGQSSARGATASDGDNGNFSNHLDADELSSYAEGVVPGPARERYTQHLAECDRCRGIVITLSQAAGATARHSVVKHQTGSSFWSTLAAIFSPAVLRYAVPALVVTAMIGIGLLALRQRNETSLVARNEGAAPAPSVESKVFVPNQPASGLTSVQPSPTASKGISAYDSETKTRQGDLDDKTAAAKAPSEVGSIAKSGSDQPPAVAESAGAAQPKYAPEPQAPPAARPGSANELDKVTTASRDLAQERENSQREEKNQRQQEDYKNQPKDEASGPSRGRYEVAGRRAEGLKASDSTTSGPQKSAEPLKRKADGEPETRTVSGRRFRREGNGWVDTSYESSRTTINVTRGSEQYRALVADEPGLRLIADQLAGELIVIWKGKAYRFQ